jgi:3-hydroxyisobutyrate dehydrogenase
MKVGFIGLGAMGQGMAHNLARQGYLQAVYNRTPSKTTDFSAEICPSPEALAALVDVIFICISADQDVLEVVTRIATSIKPGSVVVDLSTVSSKTAQQAAAILACKQVDFLDAPVSGGVEGAKKASLAIMVGGEAQVLDRVRPFLAAMGSRIEHLGNIGAGQACKAVNQIMVAGINQAVTEALAFASAQGLDVNKVVDILSGGAAGNWFLQHRGKSMQQGLFPPGFKVALHYKDLLICQQMLKQCATNSRLTDLTLTDYAELLLLGFGDEDISALYRLKRKN